ncbi:LEA/WHy family protein [Aurantivibrio infirmus]
MKTDLNFFGCFILLGCLALTANIANSQEIKEPKVTFNSVQVTGLQYPWLDLKVGFKVSNLNDFDVTVNSVDYEIFIQNQSVLVDSLKAKVDFKAGKITGVRFPVKLNINKILPVFPSLLSARQVPYRIQGLVTVDNFFIPLPFEYSDFISLQGL